MIARLGPRYERRPARARQALAAAALAIALTLPRGPARAEDADLPPPGGGIEYGPHAVGFEAIERFDCSRTFRNERGPDGTARSGERARPVFIHLWYPAEETPAGPRMVYGECSFASPSDPALFPLLSRLQEREVYSMLYPYFGGQRGSVVDLMNVELVAVRGAKPLAGPFPVVVYHSDLRGSPGENALLCEYLASHGYVVAATQPLGSMLRDPAANPDDLEALVRDKEFAVAELRGKPHADAASLALVGRGFGALAALVLAMRNSDVDAVAAFGEWAAAPGAAELLSSHRGYRPERMTVPLLAACTADQEGGVLAASDALRHSTRRIATMSGAQGSDFTNFGALAAAVPGNAPDGKDRSYGHLCRLVRLFLDDVLKGDGESSAALEKAARGDSLPGVAAFRIARGSPAPLREEELASVFWEEGVAAGLRLLRDLRGRGEERPLSHSAVRALGYQFLTAQRVEDAVDIFREGSVLYPDSAGAWANLGEACAYAGRAEEARGCFEKTLGLLPIDSSLDERTRDALKTQAETMIKRLGG